MEKVLITGVNGFIGCHLAQYYHSQNVEVIGLDHNLKAAAKHRVIKADLIRDDLIGILIDEQPDAIINCAGYADVGRSICAPEDDYAANVTSVHRLLFSMNEAKLRNTIFVQMSSAAVYGQPDILPITEESQRRPLSPYALHKMMAEEVCIYAQKVYHIPVKILRIFSAYGPGLKKQIFWDMAQKLKQTGSLTLYGTGKETRDYIYITDLIRVIDLIIKSNCDETVFNVANGIQNTLEQVAVIFLKEQRETIDKLKFNQIVREGDPLYWQADISRIKRLGYVPSVNMQPGIKMYINWLNEIGG